MAKPFVPQMIYKQNKVNDAMDLLESSYKNQP